MNETFEAKICIIPLDFPPSQVSLMLGVNSSKEWAKGDLNSGGRPFKSNWWEFEFQRTSSENWHNLKNEITDFIAKHHLEISKLLLVNCTASLSIVIRKEGSHIGLDLSPEDLELFCKSGISLDINCYSI